MGRRSQHYLIAFSPMQLVAHKLEVLQQFLSTLTILLLFLVSQEVVRYHLWMQAPTWNICFIILSADSRSRAENQIKLFTRRGHFFLLLSGPNVMRVLSQTLGHILHLSAQSKICHIHGIRIVIVWSSSTVL